MSHWQAYPGTPVGVVELKRIPAAQAYEARGAEVYWEERNSLFRRDFAFLRANELPMTVPVEADVRPGAMRFFVPEGRAATESVDGVRLVALPERAVVSAGLRGGYTKARFEEGVARIAAWLAANGEWRAEGAPYVAYWNGPATPWFLRRSEVHQRVSPA